MVPIAIDASLCTEIVSRIQAGDMQGLEDLHVRFGGVIKHCLMRRVGLDWEEHYTQVLYTIFTGIQKNRMRTPAALPGLVATIAKRTASDELRSKNRQVSLDSLSVQNQKLRGSRELPANLERKLAANQRTPEQELLASEQRACMCWGLQQLPARDQDILRRFYSDGQSIEQIKAELNLTDNQFRLRKSRAKSHLVEIIRKKLGAKRQSEKTDKTEFTGNVLAA